MVVSLVLRRKQNREVCRALADLGRAPLGTRTEPLDRRTLVCGDRLDVKILADELVIVLGVCDRRLEQLAPVTCDRAWRVGQDSACLVDTLAADVVTDQPRLARRGANVLGLCP